MGRKDSRSRIGIEEPAKRIASCGSHWPRRRATSGSDSESSSVASIAPAAASSAARHVASQFGRGRLHIGLAQSVDEPGIRGVDAQADDGIGVLPRVVRVERDLGRVESRQPRSQGLGRGHVAGAQHELRLLGGGKGRIAQEVVVMGDRGRSLARPR